MAPAICVETDCQCAGQRETRTARHRADAAAMASTRSARRPALKQYCFIQHCFFTFSVMPSASNVSRVYALKLFTLDNTF